MTPQYKNSYGFKIMIGFSLLVFINAIGFWELFEHEGFFAELLNFIYSFLALHSFIFFWFLFSYLLKKINERPIYFYSILTIGQIIIPFLNQWTMQHFFNEYGVYGYILNILINTIIIQIIAIGFFTFSLKFFQKNQSGDSLNSEYYSDYISQLRKAIPIIFTLNIIGGFLFNAYEFLTAGYGFSVEVQFFNFMYSIVIGNIFILCWSGFSYIEKNIRKKEILFSIVLVIAQLIALSLKGEPFISMTKGNIIIASMLINNFIAQILTIALCFLIFKIYSLIKKKPVIS